MCVLIFFSFFVRWLLFFGVRSTFFSDILAYHSRSRVSLVARIVRRACFGYNNIFFLCALVCSSTVECDRYESSVSECARVRKRLSTASHCSPPFRILLYSSHFAYFSCLFLACFFASFIRCPVCVQFFSAFFCWLYAMLWGGSAGSCHKFQL